jgi:Peptidase family M1 domain
LRRELLVVSCWLLVGLGVGFAQGSGAGESSAGQSSSGGQSSSNPENVTPPGTNKDSQPQNVTPDGTKPVEPAPPKGTVLFERRVEPEEEQPQDGAARASGAAQPSATSGSQPQAVGVQAQRELTAADVQLSDEDREALTFLAYDLDAHLRPAGAGLQVHARLTVRNDGKAPLKKLALQVSSSLKWEQFSTADGTEVPFGQHVLDTDADHTGQASEAILTLGKPLRVGETLELSAYYSGKVERSVARLEGIGAPAGEARAADWDGIGVDETALRGFGNVLWYPVASAQIFLGDGAALFQAVGRTKLRAQKATIRLRLTIEYKGDAPKAAYFCGRMEPLTAVSEDMDALAVSAPGVASAVFEPRTLGFRVPSLFVTSGTAKMTGGVAISAVTERDDALELYGKAAEAVGPLMKEWIAETPVAPLNILDHDGQPFEDDRLLVTSMGRTDVDKIAAGLAHSLTHAWFGSSHPWLNEGVAQLMSYLWLERTGGREAAMQLIEQEAVPLAFAEPGAGKEEAGGQSLIDARDEIYYRTKAAAVLWMLRSIAGEDALKQALHTYAREERLDAKVDENAKEFQRVLEQTSHKDLGWFFDDWVYRDRGLPDLSIESVTPRELTVKDGRGGWLVAVVVHNAGDAAVEVPVTVRSGTLTTTERIRVLGGASTSTRILFEGDPEQVVVNDGSVPEVGESMHVKLLKAPK